MFVDKFKDSFTKKNLFLITYSKGGNFTLFSQASWTNISGLQDTYQIINLVEYISQCILKSETQRNCFIYKEFQFAE